MVAAIRFEPTYSGLWAQRENHFLPFRNRIESKMVGSAGFEPAMWLTLHAPNVAPYQTRLTSDKRKRRVMCLTACRCVTLQKNKIFSPKEITFFAQVFMRRLVIIGLTIQQATHLFEISSLYLTSPKIKKPSFSFRGLADLFLCGQNQSASSHLGFSVQSTNPACFASLLML